ncbi:MAG: hypothetical protein ACYTGN_04050 [Planctomycetota bacterium]
MDDTTLRAIEQRIERVLGATEPDPEGEARHLAGVERALLEASRAAPDHGRGNPVLADAARWRDRAAELGANGAAERANEFVEKLIARAAERWRERLPGDDADAQALFDAIDDARTIDLEALARRTMVPPLLGELGPLRDRLKTRLPVDETTRQHWIGVLLDGADVALIESDDTEPGRAVLRLERVLEDLEWHRDNVDPSPRLRRKIRRIRIEISERDTQHRLEKRYSPDDVARAEKLITWYIIGVLALFFAELIFDFPDSVLTVFGFLDLWACSAFLGEFFIKLHHARRGKALWFARHFFVDFLPSLPFAFFLRWLRLARLLRLLRFMRIFGFITRGFDRIVRRYGEVLNRDIVLYPTREERARAAAQRDDSAARLHRLQGAVDSRWDALLLRAPREIRESVADLRIEGLEHALAASVVPDPEPSAATALRRELLAEEALRDLGNMNGPELEAAMGQDFVSRVARAVRLLGPLRWLPVVRRYVPRVGKRMDDADVVAAAAHKTAKELDRHHDRYFWFADLYGTVTPAQFVDRVGTAMVKGAKRPVVRLIMFGALYVIVVWALGKAAPGTIAAKVHDTLQQIVGTTLVVLGTVGLAFLAMGWWLRSVAGQATDFFTQSARAAYIGLTESIKGRFLERDAAILDRHVFAAEREVHDAEDDDAERFAADVKRWLVTTQSGRPPVRAFDHVERAVLIYRDSLDGAVLGANDVHTTAQMLGNPALRNVRLLAEGVSRGFNKRLARLDLERQKRLVGGPYMWFSLVCQAVEHGIARLVVDYNRHALPLDQLERASAEERSSYDTWLGAEEVGAVATDQVVYVTNDFTAMHFLDVDEERDAHVEARFGRRVARRLQRDRRHLVRRVFGTYPLHKRPREERVLNPYRLYEGWLAGGRALLFPLRVFRNWLKFLGRLYLWLVRCLQEIRRPRFAVDEEAAEGADFPTALRMIRRMRGPVAEAALRLRARFDPEYVGVRLPGAERSGLEEATVESDLEFLDLGPELARHVGLEKRRAARDMARLGRLIDDGLLERIGATGREGLRAAAAVYGADFRCVRRFLSASEILSETYDRARREELPPLSLWPRFRLHAAFARWWKEHGEKDRAARKAAWRATVRNTNGVRDALLAWDAEGDAAAARGETILADLLRHPERVSEQLVTLRTVQTLSLIDVRNYREHVYLLGDYGAAGDSKGPGLS